MDFNFKISPRANPIKEITLTPKCWSWRNYEKLYFNPIKILSVLKIKQKYIIIYGVNLYSQICASKIGVIYAKKWFYYSKRHFIGFAPALKFK
jgi:hypothetical protein